MSLCKCFGVSDGMRDHPDASRPIAVVMASPMGVKIDGNVAERNKLKTWRQTSLYHIAPRTSAPSPNFDRWQSVHSDQENERIFSGAPLIKEEQSI